MSGPARLSRSVYALEAGFAPATLSRGAAERLNVNGWGLTSKHDRSPGTPAYAPPSLLLLGPELSGLVERRRQLAEEVPLPDVNAP